MLEASGKEYEPFKSVNSPLLKEPALANWKKLFKEAEMDFSNKKYDTALKFYERLAEIDPEYALTFFRLGECYEKLAMFNKAKAAYLTANDKDRFPVRAPSVANKFYNELPNGKYYYFRIYNIYYH